jgi:hypothetical protein
MRHTGRQRVSRSVLFDRSSRSRSKSRGVKDRLQSILHPICLEIGLPLTLYESKLFQVVLQSYFYHVAHFDASVFKCLQEPQWQPFRLEEAFCLEDCILGFQKHLSFLIKAL